MEYSIPFNISHVHMQVLLSGFSYVVQRFRIDRANFCVIEKTRPLVLGSKFRRLSIGDVWDRNYVKLLSSLNRTETLRGPPDGLKRVHFK